MDGAMSRRVRGAIVELLAGVADLSSITVYDFRCSVARHIGLGQNGLEHAAAEVNEWIKEAIASKGSPVAGSPAQRIAAVLADLGEGAASSKIRVHLVTLSRVLPETAEHCGLRDVNTMTREEIANCVWKAFDDPAPPVQGRAGRPRTRQEPIVKKLVVFQEKHADGDSHFHVAVLLQQPRTFAAAKRSLLARDSLPAHFSTTHTQWWSAIRYGHIPTLKKPHVDPQPLTWAESGGWGSLDLFAESQRPWAAHCWVQRREESEKEASAGRAKKRRFNKLDLTSLILAKGITSKAALLEYAQEHGTEEMMVFLSNNQKHLKSFLKDAEEWGVARAQASSERETDWALVCRTAEGPCPYGDGCGYAAAATQFFDCNAGSLCKNELAAALRAIILAGPSKTTRVPLVVGPTNSGKTTLFAPFDSVFGFKHVLHKPALNVKFALRNILNEKKFIFWDDYRPVEYAQGTLPVATFLSLFQGQPFEVHVSQAFHDGNVDFEWLRGAVMTAKAEDLWAPQGCVSAEDVTHMQSRVHQFECIAQVSSMRSTIPCARCMCRWICDGACARDAGPLLHQPLLPLGAVAAPLAPPVEAVAGMRDLSRRAQIPAEAADALGAELAAAGARDVNEATVQDRQQLNAFGALREFEKRRILKAL